jgi:GTP cyclohydrolase II
MRQIDISQVAKLPTKYGIFNIQTFKEFGKEHLAIFTDNLDENLMVRVHSECLTGDVLGSMKCDCGEQLAFSQEFISKEGGMIIYHRQEGRNIGLLGKVNAYALQDKGLDTVEANHQLGFKADERTYEIVEYILDYFKIEKIQLLTNNPKKIESLKNVEITRRIPILIDANPYNKDYLEVKKTQMGHLL